MKNLSLLASLTMACCLHADALYWCVSKGDAQGFDFNAARVVATVGGEVTPLEIDIYDEANEKWEPSGISAIKLANGTTGNLWSDLGDLSGGGRWIAVAS